MREDIEDLGRRIDACAAKHGIRLRKTPHELNVERLQAAIRAAAAANIAIATVSSLGADAMMQFAQRATEVGRVLSVVEKSSRTQSDYS